MTPPHGSPGPDAGTDTVLPLDEWLPRARAHAARADALCADHLARRSRGEKHPVWDFLFEYYPMRPSHLRRWHPGLGRVLPGRTPHAEWRDYHFDGDTTAVDVPALWERRGESLLYIRDLLRAKGYFVSDQTMTGTSINGKHIGELDLEIRLEPNIPWTMCEMLNLRGSGASQRHYWDMHLQKIMVNYNPNGLPFLFLLAYVNCPVEKFQQLVHAYSEHMKQSSPERYSVLSADQMTLATGDYGENQYIRMYQAVYDCGGIPTTVYHVFVYMGE